MFHNYCYRGVLNVTPNGKAGDVPRCVWMAGGHTAWCAATAYVSAVPVVTYAGGTVITILAFFRLEVNSVLCLLTRYNQPPNISSAHQGSRTISI